MAQQRPFRFLHASHLQLEKPVGGVEVLPAHQRKRLVDAPKIAAERLFQAAVDEKVDFIILCGEILDPYQTGPWGPVFLVEQFEKLKKAQIAVFWATGKTDSQEHWPSELKIPENVTIFPSGHVEEPLFQKEGFTIARILGMSRTPEKRKIRPSDFNPDSTGLYTIAVACGKTDPLYLKSRGIDYWALGGRSKRHTSYGNTISANASTENHSSESQETIRGKRVRQEFARPSIIHYPGAMLARSPEQTGNYGVSLVTVDEKGKTTISLIPTSPVRFVREEVRLESSAGPQRLRDELRSRMIAHQSIQDGYDLLLSWFIDGSQELENLLRRGGLAETIRDELRKDFGMDEPYGWTLTVKTQAPENFPPEYYNEETILGDYLQRIRKFQMGEIELPTLESYIPQGEPPFPMKGQLLGIDPETREEFLRDVATLGLDLLTHKEEKK